MRLRLTTAVIAVALCAAFGALGAETNAASPTLKKQAPFTAGIDISKENEMLLSESAKAAINAGMPTLAKSILEDNIKKSPQLAKSDNINTLLLDSLIALGEYKNADEVFSRIKDGSGPAYRIRKALIDAGLGRADISRSGLDHIDESTVPENLRAWLHIARGYALFETGKNADAIAEFDKAKAMAKNSLAAADAEVGANLSKLASPLSKEELSKLEEDLKSKMSVLMGTVEGFQIAKQYAAVLFRLGKDAQALDVVNQQLEISLAPEIDKDELKIISASMTKNPIRQISMLKNILRSTSSADVARFSVSLVTSNRRANADEVESFLKYILENSPVKNKDFVLLELSKAAVKKDDRTVAIAYAQQLIDRYPDSDLKSGAYRILAWGAFTSDSPQYRLAASYMDKLGDLAEDPKSKAYSRYVSASCYFFDKDYATSAKIYLEIFDKLPERRGAMLNRIVESYINLGDEAKAVEFLDNAYSKGVAEEALWSAEWRIISLYRQGGRTQKALDRIEKTIATSDFPSLLKTRMMWVRAVISDSSGNYARTIDYCDNVVDMASAEDTKREKTADEIAANALLLKASCLQKSGDALAPRSIEVYERIRGDFPNTAAAPLSYLYQARVEASDGRFDKACELCLQLAKDKASPLRYQAIFDAAEYMRKTASMSSYRSALSLLDSLCSEYPDDPRNFYCRLSQAAILRLINSFSDARKLYNEIINRFDKHPEIYLAWLGLGDSTLTQPARFGDAAAIYERLYSLPGIPVPAKAESAYKWAFALAKAGKREEADEVSWLTANALLNSRPDDEVAKYWLGRSLLNLAQSLEERSMQRDAKAAYELIVKYALPAAEIARKKLSTNKE